MDQPVNQPILLGQSHVNQALKDPRFFELLPEFRSLQAKIQVMAAAPVARRGCGGCRQTRVAQNLFGDFCTVLQALSPDGLTRIKRYFGAGGIMLNTLNPLTHQVVIKVL